MSTDHKLPAWAENWKYWGLGIASDDRYKPRWYERRAYHMGLRDAARIAERERWGGDQSTSPRKFARGLIRSLHFQAFYDVLGVRPSNDQFPPGM